MTAPLHVVFDGRCGFCTRAVGWVRALDRHHRVELHAWQRPGVPERFGLTPEQCNASVWAVPTGAVVRAHGAHAVALVLDTALGLRLFGHLYRIPLVGRTQEAVYRWVAEHRGSFPGVTPWCERHPGQCAPQD